MDSRPLLALTLGDAAGIGPEVALKAAAEPEVRAMARLLLVGPASIARATAEQLRLPVLLHEVPAPTEVRAEPLECGDLGPLWYSASGAPVPPGSPGPAPVEDLKAATGRRTPKAPPEEAFAIPILNLADLAADEVPAGVLSAAAGRAGAAAVETAARLAMEAAVDAIVTAPLNKEALRLAGVPYPGHTEMLAAVTGAPRATMLLVSQALRVVHVSVHVSLREAIARVRREKVQETIEIADRAARDLGIASPRVAVAGLNPHAGEGGLFGREEIEEIQPAIEDAQALGLRVAGPLPPDTVFLRASRGEFDIVVAMYHDQGHIAVKLGGLESGVNVTLGLPILRTSVDHGTAFDIAGKGIAQHQSMVEAIRVAVQMVHARRR